jgi:hypothetical protein
LQVTLPKARPMVCNDSLAFQRRHASVRCATESTTYFPCVIDTTSEGRFISDGVASTCRMHPTYRDLRLRGELHPHFLWNNSGIILRGIQDDPSLGFKEFCNRTYLVSLDAHFLECSAKVLEKPIIMPVI